ncbi:DUF4190 domain-containing protein [Pseudalkalibacillus sp. SCS-8]|uniref:DUF4190 domain-containing protein n=1 Tax=Pseudalkalibacillus nanhaiensis TaxID=3115291 RepID=UPI0032DA2892
MDTNSNAIIGLVLSILSFTVPMFGIILGIIGIIVSKRGMNQIEETGQGGRGIAKAGFVLSIISVILQVLALLFMFTVGFFWMW